RQLTVKTTMRRSADGKNVIPLSHGKLDAMISGLPFYLSLAIPAILAANISIE
ncbi:hypothetical protein BVRB_041790, partial [Beta vulgaris subsp. vulgaris]